MKERHHAVNIAVAAFLVALVIGLLIVHEPSSNASFQTPAITNKTSAVKVISLQPDDANGYQLLMKNVSVKKINGYSIGYDKGANVTSDLTSTSNPAILPGDEFKQWLPATETVVVRYVTFDDNSLDGDATAAVELQDRRVGVREQLERILVLFRESSDADHLRTQIETLPVDSEGSIWIAAGMRNAKEDALLALKKLDKNDVRAGLDRFIAVSESRLTRLPTRVKP